MTKMYEIGRIYIWQNQVGEYAKFNGQETIVLGPPERFYSPDTGQHHVGQLTTTGGVYPNGGEYDFCAFPGDLRPKNPPSGEQSVNDLFKLPETSDV